MDEKCGLAQEVFNDADFDQVQNIRVPKVRTNALSVYPNIQLYF